MRDDQTTLAKEFQAQFARKVQEKELECLEYWKEQVDKLLLLKPEGVAALQQQIKRVSTMMGNRISTLKRS